MLNRKIGSIEIEKRSLIAPTCHICGKDTKSFIWLRFDYNQKGFIGAICLTCAARFTHYEHPVRKEKKAK